MQVKIFFSEGLRRANQEMGSTADRLIVCLAVWFGFFPNGKVGN